MSGRAEWTEAERLAVDVGEAWAAMYPHHHCLADEEKCIACGVCHDLDLLMEACRKFGAAGGSSLLPTGLPR